MNRPLLAALATLIIAGCAAKAQTPTVPVPTVAPPMLTAQQTVAARKASFLLSAGVMGSLKASIDRGDDPKGAAFAVSTLANWARTLPSLFPAGTQIAGSKALPSIWSDRAGFDAMAARYASDAGELAKLARAGDKAGFAAQWAVVRADCEACHTGHRAP